MNNFFQIDNEVVDLIPSIGHSGFIVYCFIKKHMNVKSRIAFPSQDFIAKQCGFSKRTVIDAIKKLVSNNLLYVDKRQRKVNKYFLTTPSQRKELDGREKNILPLNHCFMLPDSYYEERIGEEFPVIPPPQIIEYFRLVN